jgi:hypothetical protein
MTVELFVVISVLGDVVGPFFGQVFFGEDGLDRALIDAQPAVNAGVGVDVEHVRGFKVVVVLGGVNAVNRAYFNARGVLGVHTGLSNDVRHDDNLCIRDKKRKTVYSGNTV